MKWLKAGLDQQIRYFYLPAILGATILVALASDLAFFRKAAVVIVLVAGGALHWDLRDGGLLSRAMYSRGSSFHLRNYVTVGVSFLLVTAILVAADGFHSPLLMLYYIPIVLGAMRGGHRVSMAFSAVLAVGMLGYYQIAFRFFDRPFADANLYVGMFFTVSLASGYIADRLRRAAVDLSALYETGRALNSTLNVGEIYPLVLNIVALDLTPDVSALFMVDSQGNLRIQAHQGLDESEVRDMVIEKDRGLLHKVADEQTPISLSNVTRKRQLGFAPGVRSVMAVPLRVGEKLLGVLMVGKDVPHAYGYENLRFLEALAGQAAISIQNAWMYRQTKEWASRDALTGIYNYRYFSERLDHEWTRARRYEKPLSLIMIDLDLFKNVNDTYGHLMGDEVLRETAILLKNATRETDIVARYGGEEFVIILPETYFQDAFMVGEKLRREVEEAVFTGGGSDHKVRLTLSLGVANYPSTVSSKTDLIYQADQALYQAKSKRNTVAGPLGEDLPRTSPVQSDSSKTI